MRIRIALSFSLITVAALIASPARDPGLLLYFQRAQDLQSITAFHATIMRVRRFSTDGDYALQIDFEATERPLIEFSATAVRADWRPFGALAADVTNPSEEPINFSMEVEDAAGAITKARTQLELGPHESGSYALPLNSPSPREMGMRGEPLIPGFYLMAEDHNSVDIAHITKFRIFLVKPAGPHRLIVDSVRLVAGVTYGKIVDAFGQFALAKWPGKLATTVDFASQRRKEEAELKAHPTLPGRDEYGGWASGPQLEATGYFRTAQRDGKWWLVTPNGHLFFSFGIDAINTSEGSTVVEGREYMFKWLPAPGDALSSHYGSSHYDSPVGLEIKLAQGRTFNFYAANLARKYGRNWKQRWKSITLARLPAWGFNTIGNWSDPQLYDARRVPYTAALHVYGDFAEIHSGSDYWKPMADPFDPAFAEAVDRAARKSAQHLDDPWCIGYFVDNELSWGTMADERGRSGLALGTLSLRAGSPAKRAFVDQLRHRYATIQDLNSAWGSHISDWQTLLDKPFQLEGDFNQAIREDMHAFVRELARRYFRTVREALKKYDPNHLYLGSRFWFYTLESAEACAEFCDVVSFNIYEPTVEHDRWSFLANLGKPAIVGEFHMGAVDRGMFHPGLVKTPNQFSRAALFLAYARSVVDNPVLVGCHYFKYNDQPLTGRPGDGENYSIGFTAVVDGLYPEMIRAAKIVGREMYQRRSR
jgi:hypothetical protein